MLRTLIVACFALFLASGNTTPMEQAIQAVHPTFQPGPYAHDSILARSSAQSFTKKEREAIDQIGKKSGCHTCGSKKPGTLTGHFIPDHQPPTALNEPKKSQRLYPHCLKCSREQGLAIARFLKEKEKEKK